MLQTTLQADTFERYMDEYEVDQPLITKFLSPMLTQGMQTRTRLLTLLRGGLSHPLVLVSASLAPRALEKRRCSRNGSNHLQMSRSQPHGCL